MEKNTIGIIGGGNMGEALIRGLHTSHRVVLSEVSKERTAYIKKAYAVGEMTGQENPSVIILAVKPQDMEHALTGIAEPQKKLFISIAAGLTTGFFEKRLGKIRIVRAMPNMPAFIQQGITGVCGGRYAARSDIKTARDILSAIGETVVVKESLMDAVTAVSGSGPAYVFLFVEQWMAAAQRLGFDKFQARALVYKTLTGSVHLLEQSEFDAEELRAKVTSKGGTTQAAMDVFFKGDALGKLMRTALLAAKKRSKELAK
jgi:pyrroline-5-carboxylate reductase